MVKQSTNPTWSFGILIFCSFCCCFCGYLVSVHSSSLPFFCSIPFYRRLSLYVLRYRVNCCFLLLACSSLPAFPSSPFPLVLLFLIHGFLLLLLHLWFLLLLLLNDEGILFLPINCPKVIMYYQDTQKLQIQRPEKTAKLQKIATNKRWKKVFSLYYRVGKSTKMSHDFISLFLFLQKFTIHHCFVLEVVVEVSCIHRSLDLLEQRCLKRKVFSLHVMTHTEEGLAMLFFKSGTHLILAFSFSIPTGSTRHSFAHTSEGKIQIDTQ